MQHRPAYSVGNSLPPAAPFPVGQRPLADSIEPLASPKPSPVESSTFQVNFAPSHPAVAFGHRPSPQTLLRIVPVLPSTPSRAFAGRNFIATTGSSATRHRSLWIIPSSLTCTVCPRFGRRPCEPFPSVIICCANYHFALLMGALAAPCLPYPVRSRYVPSTSYRFLQTRPLPAAPLRFGLISPRTGHRRPLSGVYASSSTS